jgi:hypothetical protein
MGGREGINKGVSIIMGKNQTSDNGENKKILAKAVDIVISSDIRYNEDSTSVSSISKFNMCNASVCTDVQVSYTIN